MGIEVVYRRLPKAEFERLLINPLEGKAFVCESLSSFDTRTLKELAHDPDALQTKGLEILSGSEKQSEDPTRVDLQKHWQSLHFLLTGDNSMKMEHRPDAPLHNVTMGGHETTLETGYGPVRMFDTEEVQAIASALTKMSTVGLRARFSADAFNAAKVHPLPRQGRWDEHEIEAVFQIFARLVKFFEEAAGAGEIAVVIRAP